MDVVTLRRSTTRLSGEQWFGVTILLVILVLGIDLVRRLVFGDLTVGTFWTLLWRGIVDGLIIGLAAIGLSMTYSILRFANFSHGDLVTVGAFSGWTVAYVIGGIGLADLGSRVLLRADRGAPPGALDMHILGSPLAILVGMLAAGALTIVIALAIDRTVYKRMRLAGGIPLLIASIGVAFVVRYLIVFVFQDRRRGVTASPPRVEHDLIFWTEAINPHQATLVIAAVLLMVGLHLVLQYSKLGKAMRAMADNRDLALVTGIPTERVITATWVIGGGLTGIAGFLIVLDRGTLGFNLGWFLLLLIFAAVILGGIGSIYGAIVGGLIIGLATNVSMVWIPSDLTEATAFTLMILILIFRPEGIFGGVETA